MTGKPNRIIRVGRNFNNKDGEDYKEYSINSFTLPACEACNTHYATLEGQTKTIVEKIFSEKDINSYEMTILLDWFDKVRIGLWLMYYTLDDNRAFISPKFHIGTRIGQADRFLHISKCDSTEKRINFLGVQDFSFQMTPSVFGLIINNFSFINMSTQGLTSRRMGFPFYKTETFVHKDGKELLEVDIHEKGLQRIFNPILRTKLSMEGNTFYQSVYNDGLVHSEKDYLDIFDIEYVKKNSIELGKSKIISNTSDNLFISKEDNFSTSSESSFADCRSMYIEATKQMYLLSIWLDTNNLKNLKFDDTIGKEERIYIKQKFKVSIASSKHNLDLCNRGRVAM